MSNQKKCNCDNNSREFSDNVDYYRNDAFSEDFNNNCRKEVCESKLIEKGLHEIKEGIVEFEKASKELCKCETVDAVLDILTGICKEELGIEDVLNGLADVQFNGSCKGLHEIKKGIHDIEKGIREERKAIKDINNGCIRKGADEICRGIRFCEEGLCEIIDGLEDIRKDNKKRCCEG